LNFSTSFQKDSYIFKRMAFTPTPSEIATSVSHLDSTPSDLNDKDLSVSGSDWDEKHLRALRVVLLEPLPLHRLIPPEYMPVDDNQSKPPLQLLSVPKMSLILFLAYVDLVSQLRGASLDDLKEFGTKDRVLQHNIFFGTFRHLAKCIATRDAHVHGTIDFNREPTPESYLSTSLAEDKDEEPSRLAIAFFVEPILLHNNFPGVCSGGYHYTIKVYAPDCVPSLCLTSN
jgi:hypothetical protein